MYLIACRPVHAAGNNVLGGCVALLPTSDHQANSYRPTFDRQAISNQVADIPTQNHQAT
jgi:hypothetical protein